MQRLEGLYEEYGDQGFEPVSVVGQDLQGGTPTQQDAVDWAEQLGLTFPVVADINGEVYPVWDPENVLPMTWLLDRGGVIAWENAGGVGDLSEIENQVQALLDER